MMRFPCNPIKKERNRKENGVENRGRYECQVVARVSCVECKVLVESHDYLCIMTVACRGQRIEVGRISRMNRSSH